MNILELAKQSGMFVYEGEQSRVAFDGSMVECLERFAALVAHKFVADLGEPCCADDFAYPETKVHSVKSIDKLLKSEYNNGL